jgi:PKD repeat protein
LKKVIHCCLFIFFLSSKLFAQPNEWTWMKGDNIPGQAGNYGTLGVTSPSNKPGARYEACQWTDLQGNFWLYGGGIVATRFSDLWKFEPSSNNWTWMHGSQTVNQPASYGTKGIAGATNSPGGTGFGACTWTDLAGNLWLYGGDYGSGGSVNDLWKFDIGSNEWTWMHGDSAISAPPVYGTKGISSPANTPGARCETSCTWTDNSGDLWMFGGTPNGPGTSFNDLWKYTISSNEWTWMSGDNIPNQPGVYGIRGVADPANIPGGRWCYTSWKDNSGNLWLFGGIEATSIVGMACLNDLWMYDIANNVWTWMSGSSAPNLPGIYGTKCLSSTLTCPGARGETRACWKDECNNFWLFGGRDNSFDMYNDLWRYDLNVNRWFWVSGSGTANQNGIYGTIQVPAPANIPGARMGAVSWNDNSGLWLFGGYSSDEWNDLWRFTILDTACGACAVPPAALFSAPNHICPGTCTDFINLSQGATSFLWTFTGANPSSSIDASPVNICYNTPGSYNVTLIATNSLGSDTLTLNNYITVYPYPPPQAISQSGDTLFANAGAVSYQWYFNNNSIAGAINYYYVALAGGDYNVVATDQNDCEVEAVIFNVIAQITDMAGATSWVKVFPDPADGQLRVTASAAIGSMQICDVPGKKMMDVESQVRNQLSQTVDVSTLAAGIYFLEIQCGDKIFRVKFCKE